MQDLRPSVRADAALQRPAVDRVPEVQRADSPRDLPAGVIFKGSGWYITDSRKSSASETGDKAEKADKGEKGDGAASAESKPAEKATTSSED